MLHEIKTENLHNNFTFVKEVDGKQEVVGKAENIVLNQYVQRMLEGNIIGSLSLGTGSGKLDPTRTSLFAHTLKVDLAKRGAPIFNANNASITYEFELGTTMGNNIAFTEVGLSNSSYTYTHAFITDSEGNPITLTKTSAEILRIYATVYVDFSLPSGPTRYTLNTARNLFIRYLLGNAVGTLKTYSIYFRKVFGAIELGDFTSNISSSFTVDGTGISSTNMLPTTSLNGTYIYGVGLGNSIAMYEDEKPGFSGYPYNNVQVAVADGERTGFFLPYTDELIGSPEVFVDGVLQPTSAYTVNANSLGIADPLVGYLLGSRTFSDKLLAMPPSWFVVGEANAVGVYTTTDVTGTTYTLVAFKLNDDNTTTVLAKHVIQDVVNTRNLVYLGNNAFLLPNGRVAFVSPTTGALTYFTNGAAYSNNPIQGKVVLPSGESCNVLYANNVKDDIFFITTTGNDSFLVRIDTSTGVVGSQIGNRISASSGHGYVGLVSDHSRIVIREIYAYSSALLLLTVDLNTLIITTSTASSAPGASKAIIHNGYVVGAILISADKAAYYKITANAFPTTPTYTTVTKLELATHNENASRSSGNIVIDSPLGGGWYSARLIALARSDGYLSSSTALEINLNTGEARNSMHSRQDTYFGTRNFSGEVAIINDTITFGKLSNFYPSGGENEDAYYALKAKLVKSLPHISFTTPPRLGAVITANYKTRGLYKNDRLTVTSSMSVKVGAI